MEPRNWFQGLNSASLCSLVSRYDNPIPTRFLAPIDCLKIPALVKWSQWQPAPPAFCLFLCNMSLIYCRRAFSVCSNRLYISFATPLLTKYVIWQIRDILCEKKFFRKICKKTDFLVYPHIPFKYKKLVVQSHKWGKIHILRYGKKCSLNRVWK